MWVKVAFDHPVELSQLTVVGAPSRAAAGRPPRRSTSPTGRRSPSTSLVAVPKCGSRSASPRRSSAGVAEVTGTGFGAVGFSEITVPGVDLGEQIQLPEDWLRKARRFPDLAARLASAPVDYLFGGAPAGRALRGRATARPPVRSRRDTRLLGVGRRAPARRPSTGARRGLRGGTPRGRDLPRGARRDRRDAEAWPLVPSLYFKNRRNAIFAKKSRIRF